MALIMKNLLERRWLLFFIGLFIIVIIYGLYFISLSHYYSPNKTQITTVVNNSIYFERPKLKIFDENIRYINEFPDTVVIHGRYFFVVVPENKKDVTTVYDTILKKKIASFQYTALDYDGKNYLYSKNGLDTFFGNTDLHTHCKEGVIKDNTAIYCITPNSDNPQINSLVIINPSNLERKEIYSSQNYLVSVSLMNGHLYIGEKNLQTGKNFLTEDGKTIPTQTAVQVIYPIGNIVFFATRGDRFSNNSDAYYEIRNINNRLTTKLVEKGKIIFYEENNK
jgi:hypothetical protein